MLNPPLERLQSRASEAPIGPEYTLDIARARRASASGEVRCVEAGLVYATDQMSATLGHHHRVHDLPARTHSNRRPRMRIALRPAAAPGSTSRRRSLPPSHTIATTRSRQRVSAGAKASPYAYRGCVATQHLTTGTSQPQGTSYETRID